MEIYNTLECDGGYQLSVQLTKCYDYHRMQTINIKPVITSLEIFEIVTYMVYLIISCFVAKLHVQKDRKRTILEK